MEGLHEIKSGDIEYITKPVIPVYGHSERTILLWQIFRFFLPYVLGFGVPIHLLIRYYDPTELFWMFALSLWGLMGGVIAAVIILVIVQSVFKLPEN